MTIIVFLGLSVLDLGQMYATDRRQTRRRQTDVRPASSLNASALWRRGRNNDNNTHVLPIAIETAGRWDDMALELDQEIGGRTTVIIQDTRETVLQFQCLSIALHRENAVSFFNTRTPNEKLLQQLFNTLLSFHARGFVLKGLKITSCSQAAATICPAPFLPL